MAYRFQMQPLWPLCREQTAEGKGGNKNSPEAVGMILVRGGTAAEPGSFSPVAQ